ncbi:MAG: hypothetical protein HYS05_00205, partial [Acidobacteria bacterium]|nr:hypothetical protein [Acidobacteriota bacterium]
MRPGRKAEPSTPAISFDGACTLLEAALTGTLRQEVLGDAAAARDFGHALLRLRDCMASHAWTGGEQHIRLAPVVATYDSHARQHGFHVLHDWDGTVDNVNEDTIAVDVLTYVFEQRGTEQPDGVSLAILLDYYFLYILALLSVKVWEEGDPDENLDRVNQLLGHLQSPAGSGHRFVDNAETLLLIATSHYELDEQGYAILLDRVRRLNREHQTKIALSHAASLGGHLRFGFEATYGRDLGYMRNDNVVDYPWLCYALATLMREYARVRVPGDAPVHEDLVVEGILNGLSPDANAFIGDHPLASLSVCEADRSEFRDLFHDHRQDLIERFEEHRPSSRTYSPLSFFFNFSYNVLKGMVVDSLIWGDARTLTFNGMLTGIPREEPAVKAKLTVASMLMGYARVHPERIR